MFVFSLAILLTLLLTKNSYAMFKSEKKQVKVLVLADFANLKRQQIAKVCKALQKKYPNHLILPRLDEEEKSFNQQSEEVDYIYYLCTIEIERYLFSGVTVKYFHTKKKVYKTILDVYL
jgi:hypothetical protein